MFCNQCGAKIEDGMAFCTSCGAKVSSAPQQPVQNHDETVVINSYAQPQQPVNQVPVNNYAGNQVNNAPNYNYNANQVNNAPNYNYNANQVNNAPNYNYNANQVNNAPNYNYNANRGYNQQAQQTAGGSVGFGEAIKLFFTNYANFNGRSTRSEYWWAYLFNFLVSLVIGSIPVIGWLATMALLVPGLAVGVRRLHDTGKSWVYMLWSLVPLAGAIILIIQYCKESDGDNEWGPAPKF